jgi:hypothetical protein
MADKDGSEEDDGLADDRIAPNGVPGSAQIFGSFGGREREVIEVEHRDIGNRLAPVMTSPN